MDKRELLFRRRNRCVGKLLGKIERENFWQELDDEEQDKLRGMVKEAISDYHSDALDILDEPPTTRFNDHAVKARELIHDRRNT